MKSKHSGQGMVEYALVIVLVALVVMVATSPLGREVQTVIARIVSALGGQNNFNDGEYYIEILTAQCFVLEAQNQTGLWITGLTNLPIEQLRGGTNANIGTGIDGAPSPVTMNGAPGSFRFNPLLSGTAADPALCPKGAVVQGPDGQVAVAPVSLEIVK